METVNVQQGTDQWHSIRRECFTASEAPVMMGVSSFMKRDELLAMKKLGIEDEKSEYVQRFIFPKGHEAEAQTRPKIEELIGEELYPVTGRIDIGDIPLLASFDGLTMDESVGYEHKLYNESLFLAVGAGNVPDEYTWQLEQQCLVGDLDVVYFVVSDGADRINCVKYVSDPIKRKKLIAGWKQFKEDLDAYQHIERTPEPVAQPIMALPSLAIQLVGEVKTSNLTHYRTTALQFIQKINTDLQTDEDFVNAEAMVKFCGNAEKELDTAKQAALAQTQSIDELFKTVDFLREELRGKRLTLEKLVKSRKEAIRAEVVTEAATAFSAHIAALTKRIGKPYMPVMKTDFPGAIKGKKTISSVRSSVSDELARAKIAANEVADLIQTNLNSLRELAADYTHLFADASTVVLKQNDDLVALVKTRIAEFKQKEADRIEREREKIREEERVKAVEAERQRADAEAKAIARDKAQQEHDEKLRTDAEARGAAQVVARVEAEKVDGRLKPLPPMPSALEVVELIALNYRIPVDVAGKWLDTLFGQTVNTARKGAKA